MSLSERVRTSDALLEAWHAIQRNGETSRSRKTREETRRFGADLPRQLRRIAERLRAGYAFERQLGATPEKKKGKGKRPLVIAPLADRIVQRSILNTLQDANELKGVQELLSTPTSIGGIRGRGVEHAIALIDQTYRDGNAKFIAGSDISGFFTKIDQKEIVQFIASQTDDVDFVALFARALRVDLANGDDMDPEDRKLFPTDDIGVAQGCPLSALAGNVALQDFDKLMNGRGVKCIRYIDDFILLGKRRDSVESAFAAAGSYLLSKGMQIYDPHARPDKAFFGPITEGFDFLGYELTPVFYPPSAKNREALLLSVKHELNEGRSQILHALKNENDNRRRQYFSQSIVAVDDLLRAWSGSFRASRCERTANEIDAACNQLIANFIEFYRERTSDLSQSSRRRVLGVHMLSNDIRERHQSEDSSKGASRKA